MTHVRGIISQVTEMLQAKVYQGFSPGANQALKVTIIAADRTIFPSPLPWVFQEMPPLAYSPYAVDAETGLNYITIPAGWTSTILSIQMTFDQPLKGDFEVDGLVLGSAWWDSYTFTYSQPLLMVSTRLVDPTASSSHIVRTRAFNPTNRAAQGSVLATHILERVE